jgi:cell wall assembly regulator SMI1
VLESWNIRCELVEEGSLRLGDIGRVRTEGPVRAHKWNRHWILIADNGGGDARALDLDPPHDGMSGQVITQSRDVERVRVLAPSFQAYLEAFADDLEQDRYEALVEDDVLFEFNRR